MKKILNINKIQKFKSNNGLKIYIIQRSNSPISIFISFLAGSIFDPKGKEGLNHFTEHLMLYKSKNHPNIKENNYLFNKLSAKPYAETNIETMTFSLKSPKKTFDKAFNLFTDLIINAEIDKEIFEKEREVMWNEQEKALGNPWNLIYRNLASKLYFNKDRSVLGTKESLKNIKLKDVIKWHKDITNKKLIDKILILGDITKEEIIKVINKSSIKELKPIGKINIEEKEEREVKEVFFKSKQNAGFSAILIGFKITNCDTNTKDYVSLEVLADILEKRLYYNKEIKNIIKIDCTVMKHSTFIDFSVALLLKDDKYIENNLNSVLKSLEEIKVKGIKEEELKEEKNKTIENLPYEFEKIHNLGTFFYEDLIFKPKCTPLQYYKTLNKLTTKDIRKTINKLLYKKNRKIGILDEKNTMKVQAN